ncbi:MAG: YeeE/YedE family protein [Bacteroidetes bacterium]|nr:YeeE/YedE family protein [Bacteroidota bacterium]MCB0845394.1 YeeE/YedE family protein [Bacteroidota bacterium]
MSHHNYITGDTKYMNPYIAGVLLGLVLLAAFYLTGRGLGASGAMKSVAVTTVETISHEHAQNSHFYSKYITGDQSPMRSWLVFQVLGVLVGGLISGALSGRLKVKVEHSPNITSRRRVVLAVIGGLLFGFGSQLGRGCTSGAALSGMAVLSVAGFVTMIAIFGTGFALAYFFRKNWI